MPLGSLEEEGRPEGPQWGGPNGPEPSAGIRKRGPKGPKFLVGLNLGNHELGDPKLPRWQITNDFKK